MEKNTSEFSNSISNRLFIKKSPAFYIILVCEVMLALVGNTLFLLIIIRMKSVSSHMYIMMASLSLADIVAALAFAETFIRDLFIKDYRIQYETCRIATFFSSTSMISNAVHIALIAADRYLAVTYAHK